GHAGRPGDAALLSERRGRAPRPLRAAAGDAPPRARLRPWRRDLGRPAAQGRPRGRDELTLPRAGLSRRGSRLRLAARSGSRSRLWSGPGDLRRGLRAGPRGRAGEVLPRELVREMPAL